MSDSFCYFHHPCQQHSDHVITAITGCTSINIGISGDMPLVLVQPSPQALPPTLLITLLQHLSIMALPPVLSLLSFTAGANSALIRLTES
jgi:hypothetical protein